MWCKPSNENLLFQFPTALRRVRFRAVGRGSCGSSVRWSTARHSRFVSTFATIWKSNIAPTSGTFLPPLNPRPLCPFCIFAMNAADYLPSVSRRWMGLPAPYKIMFAGSKLMNRLSLSTASINCNNARLVPDRFPDAAIDGCRDSDRTTRGSQLTLPYGRAARGTKPK